jgi:hypothetical protein
MPGNKPVCAACKYWQRQLRKDEDGTVSPLDWGQCRRYAPRGYFVGGEPISISPFAETGENDWCGEFGWPVK